MHTENSDDLHFDSLVSEAGLQLPQSVGGSLYLDSLTSANGLQFPKSIGGDLHLESLTTGDKDSIAQQRPDLNIS